MQIFGMPSIGLQCKLVIVFHLPLDSINKFLKTTSVVSHVPWAAQAFQCLPFVRRDLQSLRKFAVNTAKARIKAGPVTKDLWYHLVSLVEILS